MSRQAQDPGTTQLFQQRLIEEFRGYAHSRKNDVARGAETPELAALLVEKYGHGMVKAAQLLDFDPGSLMGEVDRLVAEIDPEVLANRKERWAARPAGLILSGGTKS